MKFYSAQAPSNETIQNLVSNIATKTNNLLIRKKYLEKVEEMVLVGNTEEIFNESVQHSHEDVHLPAQAASVAHRIAFGPNTGQPVRRLRSETSLWPPEQTNKSTSTACVLAGGYSVHAETAIKAHERERLEKLVRYMARPVISDEWVIIEGPESIRIKLKSAWADGSALRNQALARAGGVAAETMRVGPSKSAIRCWLQTAASGFGQKPWS